MHLLFVTALTLLSLNGTPSEEALLDKAMTCPYRTASSLSRPELLMVLRLETLYGVPEGMRGMTLAASCEESGHSSALKGDEGLAVGILQLHPWFEHRYNTDRRNALSSAASWLYHVARQLPSIRARCHPVNEAHAWAMAWTQAVKAPKHGGRCKQFLEHHARLWSWRETIETSSL